VVLVVASRCCAVEVEEAVSGLLAELGGEVDAAVADIRPGEPMLALTQSTSPLTCPSSQSTLPGWKSRWMRRRSFVGGGSSSSSIARSQTSGRDVQIGGRRIFSG
jgi:hypothetical protein